MNENDPRVKRTRELLIQSFRELLKEKHNIYSISVQEIAKRASVNRATFYDHFEDKYTFLEQFMRTKFQQTLETKLRDASISDMSGLKTVIWAVFDFLAKFRMNLSPTNGQFEPLFEAAMQKELYHLLFKWLRNVSSPDVTNELLDATAVCVSWSIFGAALQWSRTPGDRQAESVARDVMVVVAAGLAPVLG